MLRFNQAFGALNASGRKERRFALRVEMADAVILWLVSHDDVTPGAGTVVGARIRRLSNISQRLRPTEGRAEIGTLSFTITDIGQALTAALRSQLLTSGRGALGKRVQLYVGDRRLAFEQYELVTTQRLESSKASRSGTEIDCQCADVQRGARQTVFEALETRLTASISDTDTTINVVDATIIPGVDHGSGFSDAPDEDGVIYVRIDDEIIRTLVADRTSTTYTSCVRGVLGTRAAEHTTDEGVASSPDKGKRVSEVIYVEGPAPKLAYAIQTGVQINQSGTWPDHWFAGLVAADVKLTDYTGIGLDVYDPDDDTAGLVLRFVEPGRDDAKRFVETQIMRPCGLYQPVLADGQLGMRRTRRIVPGAAVSVVIDDSVLIDPPALELRGQDVRNEIELKWNEVDGELKRTVVVKSPESIATWGPRTRKEITARGLHGSRQSRAVVTAILQQAFDRQSSPPLVTKAVVRGVRCDVELGDVVQLRTSHARNWTGAAGPVDHPFEVVGIQTDWIRGRISLDLVASSVAAAPLKPLEDDASIADAWFTSSGTNIAGLTGVVDQGGFLEITADLTLSGNADLTSSSAVYYAAKDLTIRAGVTVTYDANVQIRVLGVVTDNGKLDGKGGGLTGVADTVSTSGIVDYPTSTRPVDFDFQEGTAGGFGTTQAHGGLIERVRQENVGSGFFGVLQSVPAPLTVGDYDVLPLFQLEYRGGQVQGLPIDLRGSSGGPGGLRYFENTRPSPDLIEVNRGGTGGAGGAGLAVICRGFAFGASGTIDSSGLDGSVGAYSAGNAQPAHAGGGAGGAPGGVLIVVDGALNPVPGTIAGKVIADYGSSPLPSLAYSPLPEPVVIGTKFQFGQEVPDDRFTVDLSASSGRDAAFAATRVQYMPSASSAEEDLDERGLAARQQLSLAALEVYDAVVDDAQTVVRLTVTEVDTDDAYSHANIYVRITTGGNGPWELVGPAEPTRDVELPADGLAREFVPVPVLVNNLEAAFADRGTGVTLTVTAGAAGVGAPRITGLTSGQNLMPAAAATEQTFTVAFGPTYNVQLDTAGLEVGDPLSLTGELIRASGSAAAQLLCEFRNASDVQIGGVGSGVVAQDTTWSLRSTGAFTIPAYTKYLRIYFSVTNDGVNWTQRRLMLNRGLVALPFEQPPLRVNRGEAEEGADVTANNGQTPAWLTALVESGDINASSVEAVLNALNLVNGPNEANADRTANQGQSPAWLTALIASGDINAASVEAVLNAVNLVNGVREAGATSGVIATATGATDGDLTSVSAASFIEAATATLVLDATRTVEVTLTGWLRSAGASSTFCRVKALRDAAEIGGLSGNNVYIAGTAMTPFIHVYQATIAAGTYVFSWQFKKDASGGNIIARSRRVSARIIR